MRNYILIFLLLVFSTTGFAEDPQENDVVEVETEGHYRMRANDSKELARELALFEAKKISVESAGKLFSLKDLIEIYGQKKEEIFCLTAREIPAKILEEKWTPAGPSTVFSVRIRSRIQSHDFIKAEIQNKKLEAEDENDSFREKLEPSVSKEIDPGKDMAKAYRFLRKRQWRLAGIYLGRLETKYPHWGEVYLAKAITFYVLQEPLQMKKALEKACFLDNKTACADLKTLKRVHNLDLDF